MKDIVEFLKQNPVQYLGTVDSQNKPSICPFEFMFEFDNKLWFYTSKKKDVYEHMKQNPNVQLCVCNDKNQWVRISGVASFSSDESIKEKMIENSPSVKSIFKDKSNPDFEIFYIKGTAVMYDHTQGEPKEYSI